MRLLRTVGLMLLGAFLVILMLVACLGVFAIYGSRGALEAIVYGVTAFVLISLAVDTIVSDLDTSKLKGTGGRRE